jgi:hypothetical protein
MERAVQNTIENKKCYSSCFFAKSTFFRKNKKLLPLWAGRAVQNNRKSCECLLDLSALWDHDLKAKSNVNYGVVARFKTAKSRRMLASSLYLPQYHTSSKNKAIMAAWSAPAIQNKSYYKRMSVSFAYLKIIYILKTGMIRKNGVLTRSRKANPENLCLRLPPASKSCNRLYVKGTRFKQ